MRVAPGADTETVTITVGPSGRWVAENYPAEQVDELKSGKLRITLTVAGDAFLERLLLRLGDDVTVNRPVAKKTMQAEVAQRILARYTRLVVRQDHDPSTAEGPSASINRASGSLVPWPGSTSNQIGRASST